MKDLFYFYFFPNMQDVTPASFETPVGHPGSPSSTYYSKSSDLGKFKQIYVKVCLVWFNNVDFCDGYL